MADFATAGERLLVHARTPHGDFGAVRTDFRVDRWDAEQTRWIMQKAEREASSVLGRVMQPDGRGGIEPTHLAFGRWRVLPYLTTVEENCNLVVQNGWVNLLGSIAGTSITTKFSAAAGRIAVGTSSTAAAYADTHLGGDTGGSSTTSYCQLVSGAPTISTASSPPTLVFAASFGTGNANFAWAEFGTDNGTSSTVTVQTGQPAGTFLLNHGISSQGTKASGQTWTATETISFGYPSGSGTVS